MTISFDPNNDPQTTDLIGYRSHGVADVGAGTSSQYSRVSYNGFVFPATCRTQVTVVPEYDDPRRTVKFVTIALTVEAVITPIEGGETTSYLNTDVEMNAIRVRLSQPGQALRIINKGLGNISVNTGDPGDFQDVEFGPKPQVMEIKPIAGERAMHITWLVTTRIPACFGSSFSDQALTQSHYQINWITSDEGVTTRVVKGVIEQTRRRIPNAGSTKASNFISFPTGLLTEYQNIINKFPPIGGYRRISSYELSPGKHKLNFSIKDVEYSHNQPIFPTVVDLSISEHLDAEFLPREDNAISGGFRVWDYRIAGQVVVPKPAQSSSGSARTVNDLKKESWLWLGLLVTEKLKRAKSLNQQLQIPEDGIFTMSEKKVRHIPMSVSMSDNLYGNGFTFSFRWKLFCTSDLVMLATGFFDLFDIPGVSWEANRRNLEELKAYHKEGLPIPINNVPTDYVVDLCNPPVPETTPLLLLQPILHKFHLLFLWISLLKMNHL